MQLLCSDILIEWQKGTKNALETGRTFATLFADTDLRVRLLGARTENDFKRLLWEQMKELADEQQYSSGSRGRKLSEDSTDEKPDESTPTPVYVIVTPLSTMGYTSVASVSHSRQWCY